jgi:hypothetical protein
LLDKNGEDSKLIAKLHLVASSAQLPTVHNGIMTPEEVTEKQKGLLPWELQIQVVQFPIEHELLQEHSLACCSHTDY